METLAKEFETLSTNDPDSPQYGSAAKNATVIENNNKHHKIKENQEQSVIDGYSCDDGRSPRARITDHDDLFDTWMTASKVKAKNRDSQRTDSVYGDVEESFHQVTKVAGFLPFITKILNLLQYVNRENIIPDHDGSCVREPTLAEKKAIARIMDTYVDYEAYPGWATPPSGGLSGYKTFREAAMLVSTDASKNSISRKWDELILDKHTNPFVYVEEAKELIEDSLKYGVFKNKNEAIFKLYQSIKPGIPLKPEMCITHDVDGILKRIFQYGEFCKSAGQVTWRKNIENYQTSKQVRCYSCSGIGHTASRCPENDTFNSKGHKPKYQGGYSRRNFDKNMPKKHLRQIVHREGYEEPQ